MKIIFIIAFTLAFQTSRAQMPDSVKIFIDSALNIMQHRSVFGKGLNWGKIKDSTYMLAGNAKTYKQTAPALHYAFNRLGDKHGWLVIDDSAYANTSLKKQVVLNEDIKAAAAKGPRIYKAILKDYAYISVPFFGGQTTATMNDFAQRVQDSLCSVVTNNTKGIIIDLRLNAGGNIFPMLISVSNILGDGLISMSKDSKGNITDSTVIINGTLTLADTMHVRLRRKCGDLTKFPVAVLTGPVTGSAGEGMAVALKGHSRTILIGEETAGYTSGNTGYYLPGVNNAIVTAMDFLHDRFGNEYRISVTPDIIVSGGDHFFDHLKDKKVITAITWLDSQQKKSIGN